MFSGFVSLELLSTLSTEDAWLSDILSKRLLLRPIHDDDDLSSYLVIFLFHFCLFFT